MSPAEARKRLKSALGACEPSGILAESENWWRKAAEREAEEARLSPEERERRANERAAILAEMQAEVDANDGYIPARALCSDIPEWFARQCGRLWSETRNRGFRPPTEAQQ